jgi:putative glutamine amidotransferase
MSADSAQAKPIVLVPACNRVYGEHPYHVVGKKYVDAVRLAGCRPLIVPGAVVEDIDALLDIADGVFLTGSPSNVHPRHFDEVVHDASLPLDPARDDWTLPLIPKALSRGVPFFAICRGAQETNVALGGSLHQAVHEVEGHLDHRDPDDEPADVQYAPVHPIDIVPGGVLEGLLGQPRVQVNSLHGQAVKRLAQGLRVEARAPDGVIEAFSKPDTPGFNLAVQWHPEWQAATNPVSMALLSAFGRACLDYRRQHHR